MDTHTLKSRVLIERLLQYYGSVEDKHGRWRCLRNDRHANGDAHHSCTVKNGHLTCWSQGCFQSANQFVVVGEMEGLPNSPDQKRRLMEIAGMNTYNTRTTRRIIRQYQWKDENGNVAWHLRWEGGDSKFTWAEDAEGQCGGRGNCQPTLYHLDDVMAAKVVIMPEGEHDADWVNDRLRELGLYGDLVATCTPNGAADVRHIICARFPLLQQST
jgi:hypothetical protein